MRKKRTPSSPRKPRCFRFQNLSHLEQEIYVPLSDILLAEGTPDHHIKVLVYVASEYIWCDRATSLDQFEKDLRDKRFRRSCKSYLINRSRITGNIRNGAELIFDFKKQVPLRQQISPDELAAFAE